MQKITVLGTGLVGKSIALAKNFDVTCIDQNGIALDELLAVNPNVKTIKSGLSKESTLRTLTRDADIVVGCLPGYLGFETNKRLIKAGKKIVDISFFPEDMFELDALAKENGVPIIVDCGVAPGMGNIILGYHDKRMEISDYKCYVGGLPKTREWPYEYKAVFSPIDVIEEYIRPARYVENGNIIVRPALSDPELLSFENIGTLEAWNSDGLRSLIKTMSHIPNMIEKTMRYPGTIEYLRVLRETGYFDYEPVEIDGKMIRPIDLTSKLLFPKWKMKPDDEDITIMRIIIEGNENGIKKRYTYDLADKFDKSTNTHSMARTTGYTCTAAVNLMAQGKYDKPGLYLPEYLGNNEENFNFFINHLKDRGVNYVVKSEKIN